MIAIDTEEPVLRTASLPIKCGLSRQLVFGDIFEFHLH